MTICPNGVLPSFLHTSPWPEQYSCGTAPRVETKGAWVYHGGGPQIAKIEKVFDEGESGTWRPLYVARPTTSQFCRSDDIYRRLPRGPVGALSSPVQFQRPSLTMQLLANMLQCIAGLGAAPGVSPAQDVVCASWTIWLKQALADEEDDVANLGASICPGGKAASNLRWPLKGPSRRLRCCIEGSCSRALQ